MNKKLLLIPLILFFSIVLTFFYLLIIERNPLELPSNLLNKNVPNFETVSLLKNKNFVSSKEFGNEIMLVNFLEALKLTLIVQCQSRKVELLV